MLRRLSLLAFYCENWVTLSLVVEIELVGVDCEDEVSSWLWRLSEIEVGCEDCVGWQSVEKNEVVGSWLRRLS